MCAGFAGAVLAVMLSACAPSKEFATVPQQGAWRGGAYPGFSQKPEGATAQFSAEDQSRLTDMLQADGRRLRASAGAEDKAQRAQAGNAGSAQKQANQEIEKTLKQIQGGNRE